VAEVHVAWATTPTSFVLLKFTNPARTHLSSDVCDIT